MGKRYTAPQAPRRTWYVQGMWAEAPNRGIRQDAEAAEAFAAALPAVTRDRAAKAPAKRGKRVCCPVCSALVGFDAEGGIRVHKGADGSSCFGVAQDTHSEVA